MKAEEKAKIEPIFNKALEFWRGGDGRTAASMLERLALEYPNRPFILGMLGAIYRSLEEYERAVEYYSRTTALSPKSELASLGLFHSLWRVGRHEEAMAEMTRFTSVAPSKEYDLLVSESLGELVDEELDD
jgi:tetratricopeptide (TPR) repeat protein